MRVTQRPRPPCLGVKERLLLALSCVLIVEGMRLLKASRGDLEEAGYQWMAVLGQRGSASRPAAATTTVTAAASPAEPLLGDCRSAGPHRRNFSSQELALHEQRYRAWQTGQAQGVAMCLAVKDQHADLAEWVSYHLGLGASHIYVYDTGSQPPVASVLAQHIDAGSLTYHYVEDFKAAAADLEASNGHRYTPKYKQWVVYSLCLRDYGARHRHMAFIDSDEFLVLMDDTPDLPTLLRDYQQYGGLVANWRVLGSSGHKRHQASTLLAYTACYPSEFGEQLGTKSIVNTALAVQSASPHNAYYAGGCYAVNTAGERVDGFASDRVVSDRLLVYHYATKSLQDFRQKMERGGGLGVNHRDMPYWKKVQKLSTEQCTAAADAWRRMQQRLRRRPEEA